MRRLHRLIFPILKPGPLSRRKTRNDELTEPRCHVRRETSTICNNTPSYKFSVNRDLSHLLHSVTIINNRKILRLHYTGKYTLESH